MEQSALQLSMFPPPVPQVSLLHYGKAETDKAAIREMPG